MDESGNVKAECIVAVRPSSGLFAVYQHLRFAHRPVEEQTECPAFGVVQAYDCPVGAFSHPRQTSRTPGFPACGLLAVLHHGNVLQVVRAVERPRNRPVVRNSDFLPALACVQVVALAELPRFQFAYPRRSLCLQMQGGKQCQADKYEILGFHLQ